MARRTVGQGGSYATKDKLLCLRVADNDRVIVAAKRRSVSRIHSQEELGALRVEREMAKSGSEFLQYNLAAIARRIWNERHGELNASKAFRKSLCFGVSPHLSVCSGCTSGFAAEES
jgi:hypothetical protein